MEWKKCIICGGGGELKCPAKSLEGNAEEVYTSFIEAAKEFKVLGKLPGPLVISINDYQPGDLVQTQAKWHKSCRLKHAISKLNIAKKRQADQMDQSEESHPVGRKIKPRRSEDKQKTVHKIRNFKVINITHSAI